MIKMLCTGFLLAFVLLSSTGAEAKHFHHKQVHAQMAIPVHYDRSRAHYRHYTRSYIGAPRDCIGIPWCGCWLRHQFGIVDKSLNLAANWLRYPHVPAYVADVVVWPSHHHVGKVLSVHGNKASIQSGNSGRSGVTIRDIPIQMGFTFVKVLSFRMAHK